MSFIESIPIILFLVQLSLAESIDVISIENPLKNSRHCQKIEVQKGSKIDSLMDHLLENGCKYPVRQSKLENDFAEVISINNTNIFERIKIIVEKGFIAWKEFKQNHLEIPSDFPYVDGYPFIEEVHPICSKDENLLLRICFSKNPTRLFGRPQMFETSDGTIYQFAIGDRYLSSSTCLISGNFGRCTAKQTTIVFEIRKEFKNDPIKSSVAGSIPWTLFGITAGVLSFFLLSLIGFLWFHRNKRLEPKEQKMFLVHSRMPSIHVPDDPHSTGIPFIDDDDALVFEI